MKIKKIRNYKGIKVLVASPPADSQCPRLIISSNGSMCRDDYHNNIKISKDIIKILPLL
ncbi:MAG: hypothetical protein ACP5K5_00320 [Candidatus Micrarchaeia archaeon]